MQKEQLQDFSSLMAQGALAALKRAAKRAREIALATNTPLVMWRDGRVELVKITAEDNENYK